MINSLLPALRALAASSSLSLGSSAAAGLCAALRPPLLLEAVPKSCSAPAALCGARALSGGGSGSGGGGSGSGGGGSGGLSSAPQQGVHIWLRPGQDGPNSLEIVVQSKGSGAAGPGITAWLHAWRDAIALWATSHRCIARELEQLLGRAQQLRHAGQDEDADALLDKELATLTTLPFVSLELLPLLLEAGQYNVALRVALAAYETREERLGRKTTATVLSGIPLGVALAAAHRHNEARPLLRDGMSVAVQRMGELEAIEAAVAGLGSRPGWRTKLMRWLFSKLHPVHALWKCAGADAGFHHGFSDLVDSRYELERHWKSASSQGKVKTVLPFMTTCVSTLAQELGPDHTRVQVALREYDRTIEMSLLKRQRNLRHALQKHSRELRGLVETCRKQRAAKAELERQLYEAVQLNQEKRAQELMQQLIVSQLRKKGIKI